MVVVDAGDYERAERLQVEALELFRKLRDNWGVAVSLEHLGQIAAEQSDFKQAVPLFEESLAINRQLGDKGHTAWVLGDSGIATLAAGEYDRSMSSYAEASRLFTELGDKSGLATASFMRGVALVYQGNYEEGAASFRQSVRTCREINDDAGCGPGVDGLAYVAATENPSRAAWLAGAAEMLRGDRSYRIQLIERPLHENVLDRASIALGQVAATEALSEGRNMTIEEAVSCALNE